MLIIRPNRRRQTRQIAIATALVVAFVAGWGAGVNIAQSPRTATATQASSSFDVMEMMRSVKNLQDEKFDAH